MRPRDGDARIAWLLERRRFRQALAIAESDRTLVLLDFEQARLDFHLISLPGIC